ncbi:MAG: ribulose-phosphate 3-epimerase [bacterium]|nr:ribulose-phosphate 3-epimerase [bacterium]
MAQIAPSILAADFTRLGEEIADCDRLGVDLLHLDIMDGHFVPNISFGPAVVQTIDRTTEKFLDVHLMLSEPEKYFEPFKKAGADLITFHIETHPNPEACVKQLRALNVATGISLNPDKKAELVLPYLHLFDYLLVMSVFPGFGGQSFIESSLDTVRIAREHITKNKLQTKIEVDGGVDSGNADRVVEAGADILVMGTAFFKAADRSKLVKETQAL